LQAFAPQRLGSGHGLIDPAADRYVGADGHGHWFAAARGNLLRHLRRVRSGGAVSLVGETSTAMRDAETRWGFSTTAIHGGRIPDANRSVVTPIYQTATFRYDSVDEGARLGAEAGPGYFYTRWANPTTEALEQKMALLEGGEAAL